MTKNIGRIPWNKGLKGEEYKKHYINGIGAKKGNIGLQENNFGHKILRQHRVAGYFLDGYCPTFNLAIEIDEKYHKREEQLKKDNYREEQITNKIGCSFLRINCEGTQ